MPKYKVKRGQKVHHGRVVGKKADGSNAVESKLYHAGDLIDLEEEEAAAMPHAVQLHVEKKDDEEEDAPPPKAAAQPAPKAAGGKR